MDRSVQDNIQYGIPPNKRRNIMKFSPIQALAYLIISFGTLLASTSLSADADNGDVNKSQVTTIESATELTQDTNIATKDEISLDANGTEDIEEDPHHGDEEETGFGTLESTYLQLSFQQGYLTQRFQKGDKHQAIVKISTKGTGQMYVGWEIVQPPFSSQIDPVFVPINRVQNMLAGHKKTDFLSPILPSHQVGKYLLRVNVTTPKNGKQSAVLRYYVTQNQTGQQIQLLSPATGMTVDKNTVFKWQVSSSANQSSLQIFENKRQRSHCNIKQSQTYLTAIATRGIGTSKITPIAAHKLQQGQHYCWRVQDYEKGRLVASSEARSFIWQANNQHVKAAIIAIMEKI
jgi:hypothetical protein